MEFARQQVDLNRFGVNRICKLLGISKTTYYRSKNPKINFEQKYFKNKKTIIHIIEKNPAYGVKRIKAELEDKYHILIGRDTLGKLLKVWGLSLKRKIKTKKLTLIQKILKALASRANLLIRTKITRPLQAITSDITELKFAGGTAYLCVHKDVMGQMVYGWGLGLSMKTRLVLESFDKAIRYTKKLKRHGPVGDKLLFHQDRGSQYTSYRYVRAVLDNGTISYSDPGTPTHNPGQESFFGRFKDEWKDEIAEIKTFEELQKFVKSKINYYNYYRRHTSIGLISPYKFTKLFFKNRRL
ncbi:IS3 family transposase [Candidatus Parcubacteria bacterium]|nr:IS3 family transposase [Candidatus Parcubacteria bacterium]